MSDLSLAEMSQAATETMEHQGLGALDVDPIVVMLATNPVGAVKEAATQAILGRLAVTLDDNLAEVTGAQKSTSEDRENAAALASTGRAVHDKAYELSKPARKRTVLVAALAGFVLGAGLLVDTAKVHHDLEFAHSKQHPTLVGHALIPGTTLVADSSIMPRNTAKDVPVIGPILGAIPGIPDFGTVRYHESVTVDRTVIQKRLTLAESYRTGNVVNPVSPDLRLTGKEYSLGRKAAAKLLAKVTGHHFSADSVTITGEVSDEFNGALGKADPQQQQLAIARATVTAQAVKDEAKARGITIPGQIDVQGHETVLTARQIQRIDKAANRLKLPASSLLAMYDKGQLTDARAKKLLDRYLGDNRGEKIVIDGVQKKIERIKVLKTIPANDNEALAQDIPGEAFIGFGMLASLVGGLLAYSMRQYNRDIHKQARTIAREAGLEV